MTARFVPEHDGAVRLELDEWAAGFLRRLLDDLRTLIEDPGVAGPDVAGRLAPDAYRDDAEAASEFRSLVAGDLRAERREALDHMERSLRDSDPTDGDVDGDVDVKLDAAEVEAWMISVNHLRLALGTIADVKDDTEIEVPPDDPLHHTLLAYDFLGYLLAALVDAASDSASE